MSSITTPHFLIHRRTHPARFGSDGISDELPVIIAAELAPLGLVRDGPAFERVFVEHGRWPPIPDPAQAWNLFYAQHHAAAAPS